MAEESLKVQKFDQFKISDPQYAGLANDAARRVEIRKKLDKYNFGINTYKVSEQQLKAYGDVGKADGTAVSDGVAWAMANVDSTDKTGPIKQGKPVVLCTVTGNCVTGVHDSWKPEEYKILGTALKDFAGPGQERVPIRLTSVTPPSDAEVLLARAKLKTGTWPTLMTWSTPVGFSGLINQLNVWEFELAAADFKFSFSQTGNVSVTPAFTWSGNHVTAYNLLGKWYVPENTILQIVKMHDRYTFQYQMPQTLWGSLNQDLFGTSSADATVNFGTLNMKVSNGKLGLSGYLFQQGTGFAAAPDIVGTSITYHITAINTCPKVAT